MPIKGDFSLRKNGETYVDCTLEEEDYIYSLGIFSDRRPRSGIFSFQPFITVNSIYLGLKVNNLNDCKIQERLDFLKGIRGHSSFYLS